MADIELVIKIPESILNTIQADEMISREQLAVLQMHILNGTILPQGHKRLIAEPTEEEIAKTIGGKNDFADCIRDSVKMVFNNAPAIIKEDNTERRYKIW